MNVLSLFHKQEANSVATGILGRMCTGGHTTVHPSDDYVKTQPQHHDAICHHTWDLQQSFRAPRVEP